MNKEQFHKWIVDPDTLDENSLPLLQQIISDYPYFTAARILYLLNLKKLNDYRYDHELRRTAAFAADRGKLRKLLGGLQHAHRHAAASQAANTPVTVEEKPTKLIDERLRILEAQIRSRLHEIEDSQTRLKQLLNEKEALVNPSVSSLGQDADDNKPFRPLPKDDLLEEFLKEQQRPEKTPVPFYNPEESARKSIEENEGIISETLARLVAAQGKYDRAIKIYEQLMLKNPQKSSYFAAQIEKLRKEL